MAKNLSDWNMRCVPWVVNLVQSVMEFNGAVYRQSDDLGPENHVGVHQETKLSI